MALPNSGTMTLEMIRAEFGGGYPISLSQYYRNGGLVTSNNTNVPTSGTISLSNFYGAMKYTPGNQDYASAGTFTFSIPTWVSSVTVYLIGGGGAGSGGGYDNGDNGIAGRPGAGASYSLSVVPGSTLSVTVGAGAGIGAQYGNDGANTSITGTLNGAYQTLAVAGGEGAHARNSPGGGGGAWYLDASFGQTTDSNVANSIYTSWFGTHTGGYSADQSPNYPNGSSGIFGGGGGGGLGPNGGGYGVGGAGGTGWVRIVW